MLPARNVFGFCDGNQIWINANGLFHPLIKQGNTFEFIADLNLYNNTVDRRKIYLMQGSAGVSVGLTLLSFSTSSMEKYYFGKSVYQMNLETGGFD